MNQIQSFIKNLIGTQCYNEFLSLQFSLPCLKLLISKGLSIGIVTGGAILKVPQILKIVSSKSVKGISLTSYLLETFAYSIFVAYNIRNINAFSTWGEASFIYIQNLLILSLISYYQKNNLKGLLIWLFFIIFTYSMLYQLNSNTVWYLQSSTIFIGIASKIPQIFTIFKEKTTGQLSALTLLLQFLGSAARIFTTINEVGDPILIASFAITCGLNGILVLQLLMYWNNSISSSKIKKIKKKKA